MEDSVTDLPIRAEAVEAAITAFGAHLPSMDTGGFRGTMRAAIAAFCEAEGLTVEKSVVVNPRQRRLVGKWREVER